MLQNLNKVSLQRLRQKPLSLLAKFRDQRLSNFLLEALATLAGVSELSLEVNLQTLANAPST